MAEKVEIAQSNQKLIKGLIGSIVFILIGFWVLIYHPSVSNILFDNPFLKYGISVASILFFGLTTIYYLRKLSDKKPGLIIDDNGITDNSSAVSVGLIAWIDIDHIATTKVMKQEFLMVIVKNPTEYLRRQPNIIKRKAMEMNFKHYGSPISISANGLKCSLQDLKIILENGLLQFRNVDAT